ncbi:MAG: MCP four helix bundle domain-containing protein, partial [Bilophila sp.]
MKDLKIWVKMALGIGVLLLLVVLNGVTSINTLQGIEKDVTAIAKVYSPLAMQAAKVQDRLKDVPANMNMYMISGNQKYWTATEKALTDSDALLEELTRQVYATNTCDNALADNTRKAFTIFEKTLREAYTTNEAFV